MPIYQYACDDCGFEFERVQSFHDEPLSTCPECEGTVRRVISPVGVIFKGSGWYITDSRRQIGTRAGTNGDGGSAAGTSDGETAKAAEASDAPASSESTTAKESAAAKESTDTPKAPTKKASDSG